MKSLLWFLFILILIFQISLFVYDFHFFGRTSKLYKVGLVFSTTGFRAAKEKAALEASLLAIEEINQRGGINGKKIQPIIKDAQSDWEATKADVERLILEDRVDVIFGCWTKASRYTTKTLFEKHKHLLITPFQYEGIIDSPNIIWVGATLNQQVLPTIDYCLKHIGKRFYLVGSDYLIPHVINIMVKDQLQVLEGEVVGEKYVPFKGENLKAIAQDIADRKPEVILSSIIGKANIHFFKELREAGVTPDQIPTFSFNLDEVFLQKEDLTNFIGNYATWNYFQSIDTPINHQFVKDFQGFSGLKFLDNAAESSYIGVHLWAQAARETGSTNIKDLSYILAGMRMDAPEGSITMDMEGRRAWKFSRIGKIQPTGQFEIVWQSKSPIRPMPFQIHRSQAEWNELTDYLYREFSLSSAPPEPR